MSNIHIRFEDTIRNEFSWGISLKSIDVFTCDQNWNKRFFDRTKEENVNKLKLIILEKSTFIETIIII